MLASPYCVVLFFLLTLPRPPTSTLFPYTTLFRSAERRMHEVAPANRVQHPRRGDEVAVEDLQERQKRAEENQRSEEHTSELQSHSDLVCRLLLEKKKKKISTTRNHTINNKSIS